MWLVPCRRQALLPHILPHLESPKWDAQPKQSACLLELQVYFKSTIPGIVASQKKPPGLWTTVPKRLGRSRKAVLCRHQRS